MLGRDVGKLTSLDILVDQENEKDDEREGWSVSMEAKNALVLVCIKSDFEMYISFRLAFGSSWIRHCVSGGERSSAFHTSGKPPGEGGVHELIMRAFLSQHERHGHRFLQRNRVFRLRRTSSWSTTCRDFWYMVIVFPPRSRRHVVIHCFEVGLRDDFSGESLSSLDAQWPWDCWTCPLEHCSNSPLGSDVTGEVIHSLSWTWCTILAWVNRSCKAFKLRIS
jgi:hypothetical protein